MDQAKVLKKIEKAKKYAGESERFTVIGSEVTLRSDHGIRHLKLKDDEWICECDFYKENKVCSHTLAIAEFFKYGNYQSQSNL